MGNCEGNTYNIGMGCCQPTLGPIENYYTKTQTERYVSGYTYSKEEIDEKTSSGCCITPEEVDEKITEAVSGKSNIDDVYTKTEIDATISSATADMATQTWVNEQGFLTEHQSLSAYSTTNEMNAAIASAKTEIEGEIPSLDGYATTAYVNTQITSQTADFIDGEELSSYTYDKATIDSKIAQGGTFDPTQYYNKTATDALLDEKLDATAYTPTDLSQYWTSAQTNTAINQSVSGKMDVSDFQTFSATNKTEVDSKQAISAMTAYTALNDFTAHTADTNVHVTSNEKQTWNAKSDFSGSYNDLTNKPSIPVIWNGTKAQFDAITTKDPNTLYLVNE